MASQIPHTQGQQESPYDSTPVSRADIPERCQIKHPQLKAYNPYLTDFLAVSPDLNLGI